MPKAIQLVENLKDRSMMEAESRFDVMLNGKLFYQLYFNMTGYCGYLPLPGGRRLDIGERPISVFRKEIARLNREYAKQY